ncbi:MAG: hypothetical protein WEG56_04635 [Chloroflexota bacterium]
MTLGRELVTVSHDPATSVQGCCAELTIGAEIQDQPFANFRDP